VEAEGERNYRKSSPELNTEVGFRVGTRKSRDRDPRCRPLFSDVRGPPGQDLSCTLLKGENY